MDHRGHLQVGGVESGQPWNPAIATLESDSISFDVNGREVASFKRDEVMITPEDGTFRVVAPNETVFFRPDNVEIFGLDMKEDKTAADEVALATAATPVRQPTGNKSQVAAGVLAILLGSFGIHKFYLDDAGKGIIYLIFFWTGIPGLIGLIEGILYLTMSEAEFTRKYG